ncbi:MAG: hypothetical protein ACON37_03725 [Candidatus Puniceispirillaceae bacterium]
MAYFNSLSLRLTIIIVTLASLTGLFVLSQRLIMLTGHDYAYFLPRLLDNHLFYAANGLAWKEYTASFCAGIFEFANPQSLTLSLPQLLTSLLGPVTGIRLTFVIAASASGAGLYGCARMSGLPQMSAAIAGLMIAFSGFLISRMIVGHVTFFNFGLAPLVALLLLAGAQAMASGRRTNAMLFGGLASLAGTSIIYGGGGVILPQIAMTILLLVMVCGGFSHRATVSLGFFGAVAVATLLMAGPKLEAMLAVTGNLPRDFYPLPGFKPLDLIIVLAQSLFWVPDAGYLDSLLVNRLFTLPWVSWDNSASPIWALVVIGGMISGYRAGKARLTDVFRLFDRGLAQNGVLAILLVFPLAINVYHPDWNDLLKAVPIIGSSSNLVRWLVIYLPLLCLGAGWSWRHLEKPHVVPLLGLLLVLVFYQAWVQREMNMESNPYDPELVATPWELAEPKAIKEVGAPIATDKNGNRRVIQSTKFDHIFTRGSSNALCYEPMFGYRLEALQKNHLRISTINVPDDDGFLVLKNPACYVYPGENECRPGTHFKATEWDRVKRFVNYQDFGAHVPMHRRVLNWLGGLSLLLVVGLSVWAGAAIWRAARKTGGPAGTALD